MAEDVDPVTSGKHHFGSRYDSRIDSLCVSLADQNVALWMKFGKESPERQKFMKEEYDPTMKRVNNYLHKRTDKHPCD